MIQGLISIFLLAGLLAAPAGAAKLSGRAELELRTFLDGAAYPEQHNGANVSGALEPEFYHSWADDKQSVTLKPFFRADQHDPERTHFDLREAYWEAAWSALELRVGVRKVFWGVSESQHLVDIVNQTDLIEDPDGEDKLGQPMINISFPRDWGTIDIFMLPFFRERTFPGAHGRLRQPLIVDTRRPSYEPPHGWDRIDWAIRWVHSLGGFDIGLSHFSGTSREPRILLAANRLVPRYDVIEQSGLDLQWTTGGWLWKLEAINRVGQMKRFAALSAGFEYTLNGLLGPADLGLLAEYLSDERGKAGPSPTDNDLFAALRLTLNDAQSTELLAGLIQDLDTNARFFNVEGSRRFGERWKMNLEGRFFAGAPPSDPAFGLRRDHYVETRLALYF